MWGGDLNRMFAEFIIGVVLISAAIGGLAVWGLPKLWSWIKPLIHSFTG